MYCGENIPKKHIMDNSCGRGAFLVEIVRRYIAARKDVIDAQSIGGELATYIHGIDVESNAVEECIKNLDSVAEELIGLKPGTIKWDVTCSDTLTTDNYDGKMDFVVGNPPYVRVQNFKKNKKVYDIVKSYDFCKMGSSDLYMAFYEKGLRMLSPSGTLCYISPIGWLKGPAGKPMRTYVKMTRCLAEIIDFDGKQVFDGVTSYVSIFRFNKHLNIGFAYSKFGSSEKKRIVYESVFIGNEIFLGDKDDLKILGAVEKYDGEKKFRVKNGIATLLDDFFIYDERKPGFGNLEIPIFKASTGEEKILLYPYDNDGCILPGFQIRDISEEAYEYFNENEERLTKRDYDGEWYGIGRKQGISDVAKNKLAINNIIRSAEDLKINFCPKNSGVYSGYYIILSDDPKEAAEETILITKALCSDDFIRYVKALGKHKSGGYYTFTSKNVENFLNWKLGK
jgi:adenine-specific DNA-methyltransferase